jgi:hypothetical protein
MQPLCKVNAFPFEITPASNTVTHNRTLPFSPASKTGHAVRGAGMSDSICVFIEQFPCGPMNNRSGMIMKPVISSLNYSFLSLNSSAVSLRFCSQSPAYTSTKNKGRDLGTAWTIRASVSLLICAHYSADLVRI